MTMKTYKSIASLFLFFLSISIPTASSGQGIGEISGRIVDSISNEPIPFATVSYKVAGTLTGVVADFDGYFKIKPLNPGYYDLNFRFVGYNPKRFEHIRVNADKTKNIGDVHLGMGELEEVVIIYYIDKLIDPWDPSAIPMGLEDIEASPEKLNPMAMIANSTTNIVASDDGQQLYFRGERSQASMFIVDGVKTRNGQLGIPGGAIGHMTIYTGGVPAKYGDFTGGVVVIETKSYFDIVSERTKR